jgi:hypothetical protein
MGLTSEDAHLEWTLERLEPGVFKLIPKEGEEAAGFIGWDEQVVNLDSAGAYGRTLSHRLQWNSVILTPAKVYAETESLAKEALRHVTMCFAKVDSDRTQS